MAIFQKALENLSCHFRNICSFLSLYFVVSGGVKLIMIQPISWQYDLGFRIAARYEFDFFIESEHSLTEKGEYSNETREPTRPELTMWYKIIPGHFRQLLSKLWTSEYEAIEAIPQELSSALSFRSIVYLNPDDFAIARSLKEFSPELDHKDLQTGRFG